MTKISTTLLAGILLLLPALRIEAQEETLPLLAKSQYFSIFADRGVEVGEILAKLNYNYFLQIETLMSEPSQDLKVILGKTFDAIYLQIADVLGIKLIDYHCTIKILRDQQEVQNIFQSIYHVDFQQASFYHVEDRVVYIAANQLTLGMLGHEVAHALITHYFIVPPPPKIEEVLSGYVEYKLRKATGTIPEMLP